MMIQWEVDHMPMESLEQPMANNKCGFYVMWTKYQYLSRSTEEGNNKMVCMLPISCISVNSTKQSNVLSYLCFSISSCLNDNTRNLATKSW